MRLAPLDRGIEQCPLFSKKANVCDAKTNSNALSSAGALLADHLISRLVVALVSRQVAPANELLDIGYAEDAVTRILSVCARDTSVHAQPQMKPVTLLEEARSLVAPVTRYSELRP